MAGEGGAVSGRVLGSGWVADERWRALFGVALRCSASLFLLVTLRWRRWRARCGLHGMQEVWGSNPHSSTQVTETIRI